jgi:DNA topoisomerase II
MADLAHKYQRKTDKQHILDNPDTYIGSVEKIETTNWVFEDGKIIQKLHTYIPGLYKLFDEGIVNCRDHVIRMMNKTPVTYIDITIHENGEISMLNDGDGIDVEIHPEYNIYIPELIFGHLRTSTNYDKTEKKIVGGKNGFGFKLVLIWSEYGSIETVDAVRKKKYTQTFRNNLDIIEKPIITASTKKSYTKITFKPDYKRLGMDGLDEHTKQLFIKRIYDIAAVTDKTVKVKYNGELLPVKTFANYIDMYIDKEVNRVYEIVDRWEYAICLRDEFTQISFVNGIHTSKGGKHVEYIMNQIIRKVTAYILAKKKIEIKAATLRENLMIFLNCSIENPSFDSQTKDYLNTPYNKFGSTCEVSDKFIEQLMRKLGLMDMMLTLSELKEKANSKKTDGAKTRSIIGIPKLMDANYAGTGKSHLCTLILCEGDSAKSGVVSGLSTDDRNYYGIYPLKGKLLNVRDENIKKINENKEITEIKKIMGLENHREYTEDDIRSKLRYSKILFITDQDLDGSHIKGLGINLFGSLWKSLMQIPDFIGFMNTPIIKAKKGKGNKEQEILFYNEGEYREWLERNEKGWEIKYYKGLGTSTAKEFKEYFKNKKIVYFDWTDESDDTIDKVFNKKRADDRKEWLCHYNRELFIDTSRPRITYNEFVNNELIHFSKYDCDRSIPNLVDGLKISQRKILFAAFKKNLVKEIKVAQFSGYVSEHSAYHHGESSLNGAIVGMAQDFVGSNNINLLLPNGSFGTRLHGGKDSASERYIKTELNPITRKIFPEQDDKILKYLDDDGLQVEPNYYIPIIPMVLINGCKGIGTGFSTEILCYNPIEIIEYIMNQLNDIPNEKNILPYYKGYKGSITQEGKKYTFTGIYHLDNLNLQITELPVGTWSQDYKEFLEELVIDKKIKEFKDNCTDEHVDFKIKLNGPMENIEKEFKLVSTKTITNMHLFNEYEQLKKYDTIYDIMDDFLQIRLKTYDMRKTYLVDDITNQLNKISNKVKYIMGILNDKIDLRRKQTNVIMDILMDFGLDMIDDSYNYLIKMPMDSVSKENVDKLLKEEKELKKFLDELKTTTVEQLWLKELTELYKMV